MNSSACTTCILICNLDQVLDSTRFGNKLRFINHQADGYIFENCYARITFCNYVQRIGIFAGKDIATGTELLFNYGEAFAQKFDLVKLSKDGQVTIEKSKRRIDASDPHHTFKQTAIKGVRRTPGSNHYSSRHEAGPSRTSRKRRRSEANLDGSIDLESEVDEDRVTGYESYPESDVYSEPIDSDEETSHVPITGAVVGPRGGGQKLAYHSLRMKKAWIMRYEKLGRTGKREAQALKVAELEAGGKSTATPKANVSTSGRAVKSSVGMGGGRRHVDRELISGSAGMSFALGEGES